MAKLMLRPSQADYSVSDPEEYVATETRGGLPKTRRDIIGASHTVTVTWVLDVAQYQYLVDFDAVNVARNSEPFEVDLCINSLEYKEYSVTIVPQSLTLTSQRGDAYFVSIKFEVDASNLIPGEDPLAVESDDGDDGNPGEGEPGPGGGGAGYFPPFNSTLEPFLYDTFDGDGVLEAREPDIGYYEGGWTDVADDGVTIDGRLLSEAASSPYLLSGRYGPSTPAAQTTISEWIAEWVTIAPTELDGPPCYLAVISEAIIVEATLGTSGDDIILYLRVVNGATTTEASAVLPFSLVVGGMYSWNMVFQKYIQTLQIMDIHGGIQVVSLAVDVTGLAESELYVSTVEAQVQGPGAAFESLRLMEIEPAYTFLDRFDGSGVVTSGSHVPDVAPAGWRWRVVSGAPALLGGALTAPTNDVELVGRAGTYISAAVDYSVRFSYTTPAEWAGSGPTLILDIRGAWGQLLETIRVENDVDEDHTLQLGSGTAVEVALALSTTYTGELRVNTAFETELVFLGETLTGTLQNAATVGDQWPHTFGVTLAQTYSLAQLAVVEYQRGGSPAVGDYCELSNATPYDDEEYGLYVMDNFTGTDGDASAHTPDVGDWAVIQGELYSNTLTPSYDSGIDATTFSLSTDAIPSTFFDDPWRLDFRVSRFNVNVNAMLSGTIDGGDQCYYRLEFVDENTVRAEFHWRFEDGVAQVIGPVTVHKPFCQWIDFSLIFAFGDVSLNVDGLQVGVCSYATDIGTGAITFECTPDVGHVIAPGDIRLDCFSIRNLPPI